MDITSLQFFFFLIVIVIINCTTSINWSLHIYDVLHMWLQLKNFILKSWYVLWF